MYEKLCYRNVLANPSNKSPSNRQKSIVFTRACRIYLHDSVPVNVLSGTLLPAHGTSSCYNPSLLSRTSGVAARDIVSVTNTATPFISRLN